MKAKLLSKSVTRNKETLVFKNTVKSRIPVAKAGFVMKSKRDKVINKRVRKITVDNWDRV